MASKILLILVFFTISGFAGYFLGSRTEEKRVSITKKETIIQQDKKTPINTQILTALPSTGQKKETKEAMESKKTYLMKLLSDPNNMQTYNKTLRIFRDAKNKEFLALWVTLGNDLFGPGEYGELLQGSLQKINENPDDTLDSIRRNISSLDKEDDTLRGNLNNLVNELEVDKSQKIDFFGSELNRPIALDENGGLAEGSVSMIHSIYLLKQNATDIEEIKPYLMDSLDKNPNNKERIALRYRYLEYFPSLANEI
ncbi:MAG: hypothetical protein ACHQYQ_02700 [Bacteriovoracales bacterium]